MYIELLFFISPSPPPNPSHWHFSWDYCRKLLTGLLVPFWFPFRTAVLHPRIIFYKWESDQLRVLTLLQFYYQQTTSKGLFVVVALRTKSPSFSCKGPPLHLLPLHRLCSPDLPLPFPPKHRVYPTSGPSYPLFQLPQTPFPSFLSFPSSPSFPWLTPAHSLNLN